MGTPRSWAVGLCAVSMLLTTAHARAQSAADKATAREAATQAIERYRAGEYEAALDLMKRAQALYDAPVHLLYIARSERELGHLVEAAEVYRTLSRIQLEPDAPRPFHDAVESAKTELEETEARIPKLIVELHPQIDEPRLEIDGTEVPAAVIGIERPINPGSHRVRIEADGFVPAEETIDISEKETARVRLQMTKASKEEEAASATPLDAPRDEGSEAVASASPSNTNERQVFLIGLRLGALVPGGNLPAEFARPIDTEGTVSTSDTLGTGGEFELRLGAEFPLGWGLLDNGGFHVFLGGAGLGTESTDPALVPELSDLRDGNLRIDHTGALGNFGIGIRGSSRRDEFGGFAEVGLGVQLWSLRHEPSRNVCLTDEEDASSTRTATGGAVRLGGGLLIPVESWFLLTPYLTVSAARLTNSTFNARGCYAEWYEANGVDVPESEGSFEEPTTATAVSVGIGGEFFWAP